MAAVLGGLGAAIIWAAGSVGASHAARGLGPMLTLAWVMLIGLVFTGAAPAVLGTATLVARRAGLARARRRGQRRRPAAHVPRAAPGPHGRGDADRHHRGRDRRGDRDRRRPAGRRRARRRAGGDRGRCGHDRDRRAGPRCASARPPLPASGGHDAVADSRAATATAAPRAGPRWARWPSAPAVRHRSRGRRAARRLGGHAPARGRRRRGDPAAGAGRAPALPARLLRAGCSCRACARSAAFSPTPPARATASPSPPCSPR